MEQPIFTAKAHVFHIDPQTKRSWIPASQYAVNVNFYYDSGRSLYRIISVEDTKAIINSTITPNMTFTKTSQKFGQWTDIRANTIYGLGFNSEPELNKFIEKFQEVKEATKSAVQQKLGTTQNATSSTQQQNQIIAPPTNLSSSSNTNQQPKDSVDKTDFSKDLLNSGIKQPLAIHQRSQSLSGLQLSKSFIDSPKHGTSKMGSQLFLPQTSAEAQLKHENDRLKVALAQSSSNAKKWEVELQTLKNNNTRLTNALQESTANVEEWKKQLSTLKEENSKMRIKIMELEACNGNNEALEKLKEEFEELRFCNFQLESLNNDRLVEINYLKAKLNPEDNEEGAKEDFKLTDKNKPIISEVNTDLANCVTKLKNIHQKLNSIIN